LSGLRWIDETTLTYIHIVLINVYVNVVIIMQFMPARKGGGH